MKTYGEADVYIHAVLISPLDGKTNSCMRVDRSEFITQNTQRIQEEEVRHNTLKLGIALLQMSVGCRLLLTTFLDMLYV
jgi:hypothetical protein